MQDQTENQQSSIESLGEILREKRQNLKIEIAEAASFLRIKIRDIEMLESGDNLSGKTNRLYGPGLIRAYAKFLRIDPKKIEEEIKKLSFKSNVENKKHRLINIGGDGEISPNKELFFNALLIFLLMFFLLLSVRNFYQKKTFSIKNEELIKQLETMNSNGPNS